MPERLADMTLPEKLREADKLVRELIHHLEHGFIPKAHQLRHTARLANDPQEAGEVTDMTIRSLVESVLESDQFSRHVTNQLQECLSAIDDDTLRALRRR